MLSFTPTLPESSKPPFFCRSFSWARLRANSCARQLRGFCFPGSSQTSLGPSHKAAARFGSRSLSLLGAPRKWGRKRRNNHVYLNSVTIIGFVGADPEQRQARNNNGSKFTVLSVATQRSWKNAAGRVGPRRPSGTASASSAHGSPNTSQRPSRRARTSSSKAASSARPTNAERQRQEGQDHQDHFVVDSRRCRAQARPRRTRTGALASGFGCRGAEAAEPPEAAPF